MPARNSTSTDRNNKKKNRGTRDGFEQKRIKVHHNRILFVVNEKQLEARSSLRGWRAADTEAPRYQVVGGKRREKRERF